MGADGRGSGGRKGSSPAKPAEGRTSSLLAGLPSRGNFTESDVASSMARLKVYICLHDTAPPEGQVVKTDTNNILIRALQLSKHKSEAKDMSSKTPGESSRGKRNAARNLDGKNPSKRPNIGSPTGSSAHEESSSGFSELTLQSFTVEKLRSLLKERGLSPKGKKDELIARLRDASG
ncbi:protein LOWER TEMPERATURE 1 [Setaria viridis]|uniref:protein LOWER TEMPERATURE 1 n=1 Tax=Setaria viridis TaxID=4556 RepID=UPI003B3B4D1C